MKFNLTVFLAIAFAGASLIMSTNTPVFAEWCPYEKGRQWPYKYWIERKGGGFKKKLSTTCASFKKSGHVDLVSPIGNGTGKWRGDWINGFVYYKPPLIPLFYKGDKKKIRCYGAIEACGFARVMEDYYFFSTGTPFPWLYD